MSFDFSTISTFKPKVESTFLNKGGGGGNTGYFQQGRKKKDDEKDSILSQFLSDDKLEKIAETEFFQQYDSSGFLGKVKSFLGKIK